MKKGIGIVAMALLLLSISSTLSGRADDAAGTQAEAVLRHVVALKDPDAIVRLLAAKALGELGPAAKPALTALGVLANDPDPDVRGVAARAIEKLRAADIAAAAKLVERLRSDDPIERIRATRALGEMGTAARSAIPALQGLAKDPDEDVRRVAVTTLAKIRAPTDPEARELIGKLGAEDAITRIAAAKGLGAKGADAEAAIPSLERLAADPDEDVRRVAAQALKRIQESVSDEPMAPTIRALVAELASPDQNVRKQAIFAIGRLGKAAQPAMTYLEAVMNDPDPGVRIAAAEVITVLRAAEPLRLDAEAGTYAGAKLEDKDILSPIWKSRRPQKGLLPPPYDVRTTGEARANIRTVLEGAVWTLDKAGLLQVHVRLPAGWAKDFGAGTMDLGGPLEPDGDVLNFKLWSDGEALGSMISLDGTLSRPDRDLVADIKLSIVGANMLSAHVLQQLEPPGGR